MSICNFSTKTQQSRSRTFPATRTEKQNAEKNAETEAKPKRQRTNRETNWKKSRETNWKHDWNSAKAERNFFYLRQIFEIKAEKKGGQYFATTGEKKMKIEKIYEVKNSADWKLWKFFENSVLRNWNQNFCLFETEAWNFNEVKRKKRKLSLEKFRVFANGEKFKMGKFFSFNKTKKQTQKSNIDHWPFSRILKNEQKAKRL